MQQKPIVLVSIKSWFVTVAAAGIVVGLAVFLGLWHELRIHPNAALADIRVLAFGLDSLFGFGAAFWLVVGFITLIKRGFIWTKNSDGSVQEYPSEAQTAHEAFQKGESISLDRLHEGYFKKQSH